MIIFLLGSVCGGFFMFVFIAVMEPSDMRGDGEWCGCDGAGMAHKPGGKGFACEVNPLSEETGDN